MNPTVLATLMMAAAPPASPPTPASTPPATAAADPDKPGLAVLDLVTLRGVDEEMGQVLNESILTHLKETKRFGSVLGGSDMRAMLDLDMQMQSLGCDEDSCAAQLGGALGVPYLATPTLGQAGGMLLFSMKVIEVDEAKVVSRITRQYANETSLLAELPAVIKATVAQTFGEDMQLPKSAPVLQPAKPFRVRELTAVVSGLAMAAGGYTYFSLQQLAYNQSDQGPGARQGLAQATLISGTAISLGAVAFLGGAISYFVLD